MIAAIRRWLGIAPFRADNHIGCVICGEWMDLFVSSSRFVEDVKELWAAEHEHLETAW